MANSILLRKIHTECPLCDKIHEIEERKRFTTTTIKDDEVEYEERYYFCSNCNEDENEFESLKMTSENLLNARNAYRKKHHLLTSDEIVEIRARYGLSQIDLAKLLGWGEATISRYESKAIQDDAYDNMLRIIKDNPLKAIEFLDKNRDKFTISKRNEIRSRMIEKLDSYGKEFLARQALEGQYVVYSEQSDSNGYRLLDIDKIECMVSYFAEKVANLYKVKLMKMIWYADALAYKMNGRAMTGLVYRHEQMGALPIGHYSMMNLENINIQEEEWYDATKYHFYPNKKLDMSCLTKEDIVILDMVISKFRDFSTTEIVEYMHGEHAYLETNPGDIIPFSLAKEITPF